MNTGLIIRPTDDAAQAALALPTPAPGSHAVTTDLAPSQVVAAAASVSPPRSPVPALDSSRFHAACSKFIDLTSSGPRAGVPVRGAALSA